MALCFERGGGQGIVEDASRQTAFRTRPCPFLRSCQARRSAALPTACWFAPRVARGAPGASVGPARDRPESASHPPSKQISPCPAQSTPPHAHSHTPLARRQTQHHPPTHPPSHRSDAERTGARSESDAWGPRIDARDICVRVPIDCRASCQSAPRARRPSIRTARAGHAESPSG